METSDVVAARGGIPAVVSFPPSSAGGLGGGGTSGTATTTSTSSPDYPGKPSPTRSHASGAAGAASRRRPSPPPTRLTTTTTTSSPLVASCRHLLRPNGSVLGSDVARTILPLFPSLCSAIPTSSDLLANCQPGHESSSSTLPSPPRSTPSLASIDSRRPISSSRIKNFVLKEFGPALHRLGYGKGHRIAVVLPNGPELALAILAVSNWASCAPLNACGARSELEADLRGCDADLVVGPHVPGGKADPTEFDADHRRIDGGGGEDEGKKRDEHPVSKEGVINKSFSFDSMGGPHRDDDNDDNKFAVVPPSPSFDGAVDDDGPDNDSAEFLAFGHVRETAMRLNIPFVGLRPSRREAGIFELVPDVDSHRFVQGEEKARLQGMGGVQGLPYVHPKEGSGSDSSGQDRLRHHALATSPRWHHRQRSGELFDAAGTTSGAAAAATMPPPPPPPPETHDSEADVGGGGSKSPFRAHLSRPTRPHHEAETRRLALQRKEADRRLPNDHSDEVLVLFTSGTTGTKKLVPHLLGDMLVATATIALSWNLTPSDVNCNLMPLFHVGGIVRQVFSPVLSGGCVICCPSFDPSVFWALLQRRAFTWYYAAPTMHQLILQTGKERVEAPSSMTSGGGGGGGGDSSLAEMTRPKLRMIANAAGGLLPSLARELRETFRANVLPSYGMTECMPISSPPADYQLERPGTSGVAVGPEIAILDGATAKPLPTGQEGPICVRGEPCFRGYGHNSSSSEAHAVEGPRASFLDGGWFDTGDLGYLDADGYLYITGRSKEVINRGGEIISPLEVEEAVAGHPDVRACAAFSAPHNVLQEVVGILVVPASDRPRIDLHVLHEYLGEERLASPKWPQCLVFVDGLPKSHTNKLLRVKLCKRLGLPELNDGLYPIERTFQAKCPPQGTPTTVAIPTERVSVDPKLVQSTLVTELVVDPNEQQVFVVRHPSRIGAIVAHLRNVDRGDAVETSERLLHRYAVPTHFVTLDPNKPPVVDERYLLPPLPADAVSAIKQGLNSPTSGVPPDPLVADLQTLFQDLLDLDCAPAPDTNFFNLGGSSLLASQLASKLRRRHGVPLSGAEVFHHASCAAMAKLVKSRSHEATTPLGSSSVQSPSSAGATAGSSSGPGGGGAAVVRNLSGTDSSFGSGPKADTVSSSSSFNKNVDVQNAPFAAKRLKPKSNPFVQVFQFVPLCVVFPIWQVSRFFLFFTVLLAVLGRVPGERNLFTFVLTLVFFHLVWVTFVPFVAIAIKWIVIGKYRPGRYPIWGSYYLRWWFVDVACKLIGRGIWGSTDVTLNWYYRLMGASIGGGARISLEAEVAEYDLVTIGDRAAVEHSTVRPFGIDNGSMILGPVIVGNDSSVGVKSVVAPFTKIRDGEHLGPVSSSYEVGGALDPKHARYNRKTFPGPSPLWILLVGNPITFFVDSCSHVPALLVLYWMIRMPWHEGEAFNTMSDLMEWLCDVRRIPFYLGIRFARAFVAPIVYMAVALLLKWFVIGKFEPGPRDTASQWQLMRHWLAATLYSKQNLQAVTELIGRHYELVSVLYRLLGAKVGKRVFWPGQQPTFTGQFDLLEIGDDVVFGSRSATFCITSDSCEKVRLCAGSNLSDNCVVLPGCTLGKNAVLGSNGIGPEGWYLPESSLWLGSRGCEPVMLEKGVGGSVETPAPDADGGVGGGLGRVMSADVPETDSDMAGDETTLRPFGKAFYNRDATYYVWPLWLLIVVFALVRVVIVTVHTLPLLGALHGAAGILYGFPVADRNYDAYSYSAPMVYLAILSVFFFTHIVRLALWLAIELGTKWTVMKRRQEGRYNWDTSTYAQRWELYQTVTRIRQIGGRMTFLDFLTGTPFLSTLFRWNGCTIGKDCCLYPKGGDPVMTEPDLVTMGDGVVVDEGSIICHLNTRGNFELMRIDLEHHVTLRSKSRIQQGGRMEAGSMLLEKSLAMTGEVIESDSVWQGSPAFPLLRYSHSASIRPSTSYTSDLDVGQIV